MQDEITKHSKKVIKVMKNDEWSGINKIKELGYQLKSQS